MTNNKCPNSAKYILPWGGKLLKMCAVHARGIQLLGGAIGSPVEIQPITENTTCMGPNDLDMYKPKENQSG